MFELNFTKRVATDNGVDLLIWGTKGDSYVSSSDQERGTTGDQGGTKEDQGGPMGDHGGPIGDQGGFIFKLIGLRKGNRGGPRRTKGSRGTKGELSTTGRGPISSVQN